MTTSLVWSPNPSSYFSVPLGWVGVPITFFFRPPIPLSLLALLKWVPSCLPSSFSVVFRMMWFRPVFLFCFFAFPHAFLCTCFSYCRLLVHCLIWNNISWSEAMVAWATAEGTTEQIFRVPDRNQTHINSWWGSLLTGFFFTKTIPPRSAIKLWFYIVPHFFGLDSGLKLFSCLFIPQRSHSSSLSQSIPFCSLMVFLVPVPVRWTMLRKLWLGRRNVPRI